MKLINFLKSKLWRYGFPLLAFVGTIFFYDLWIGGVGLVLWVGTIAFNEL